MEPWYQPHEKQRIFHDDAYKVFYRLVSCGTGAGKTLCGLAEDLSWCLDNHGIVGYVFEPTYRMVERILIPTLESDLLLGSPLEANSIVKRFNRANMKLELINGSVLWFGSLEDPERAEGPNVDFVHVDEARLIRHFDLAWQVITRRLRGSNTQRPYPRGAWVTTTPDMPGSSLYNFFENPNTRDPEAKVYRWSIYDNPLLPKQFIAEIERSHKGALGERFIYGRFATVGSGSFQFDATVHLREANRDDLREIRYGIDFGWTNPTAVIVTGIDGDGRVYALDELYERQLTTERLIEGLTEFAKTYGTGKIVCDPSSPETIDTLRRVGFNVSGNKVKREDGLRELGSRFPMAGDGKPRIFVSEKCANLITELLEYQESVKENDHAVDALRYSLELYPADENVGAMFIHHRPHWP
jgi:phage terminase large subunit-like protein